MLDDVTVIAWGEFGRTPQINKDAGRDHWPQVSCALLAGGGMKTGQVIGTTNRLGEYAKDRPVDVRRDLRHALPQPRHQLRNDDHHRPHRPPAAPGRRQGDGRTGLRVRAARSHLRGEPVGPPRLRLHDSYNSSMTPAIRVRGLVKTYPGRPPVEAVRGLDLEVPTGECFGLLGPNGAGKTTTLEIIEGLLDPTAGEVEVLGLRWGDERRRDPPQDRHLAPGDAALRQAHGSAKRSRCSARSTRPGSRRRRPSPA